MKLLQQLCDILRHKETAREDYEQILESYRCLILKYDKLVSSLTGETFAEICKQLEHLERLLGLAKQEQEEIVPEIQEDIRLQKKLLMDHLRTRHNLSFTAIKGYQPAPSRTYGGFRAYIYTDSKGQKKVRVTNLTRSWN